MVERFPILGREGQTLIPSIQMARTAIDSILVGMGIIQPLMDMLTNQGQGRAFAVKAHLWTPLGKLFQEIVRGLIYPFAQVLQSG